MKLMPFLVSVFVLLFISGTVFSQCPQQPNGGNGSGGMTDTTDTSMQNGDTTMQDGDTSLQNGDTTMQDGDTSMQNGDTTMQDGDTSMQNGDSTMQDNDTSMQNEGDTSSPYDESSLEDNEDLNEIPVADSSMDTMNPDYDTSMNDNGSDSTDTSFQNSDSSMQNGDSSIYEDNSYLDEEEILENLNNIPVAKKQDTSMQNGESTPQNGDTSLQNGDTTMQDGDTSMQNGDTTMQDRDTSGQQNDTMSNDNGGGDGSRPQSEQFDPSKLDTLEGQVLSVDSVPLSDNDYHLNLIAQSSDEDTIYISLAPLSYLRNLNFSINPGDKFQIVGSETKNLEGKSEFLATQVIIDRKTFLLRDENGTPFWPEQEQ